MKPIVKLKHVDEIDVENHSWTLASLQLVNGTRLFSYVGGSNASGDPNCIILYLPLEIGYSGQVRETEDGDRYPVYTLTDYLLYTDQALTVIYNDDVVSINLLGEYYEQLYINRLDEYFGDDNTMDDDGDNHSSDKNENNNNKKLH